MYAAANGRPETEIVFTSVAFDITEMEFDCLLTTYIVLLAGSKVTHPGPAPTPIEATTDFSDGLITEMELFPVRYAYR